MGREVRRVPKDWQHPKNARGSFIPLFEGDFARAAAEWDEGAAQWAKGLTPDYAAGETCSYEEWNGKRPDPAGYMPAWTDAERTHLMMYEDTSEGTPISPAFETAEELARWLADNGASAFAGMTATYEQWLNTIRRGSAVSAVVTGDGQLKSGVAALSAVSPRSTE
jgi:hypothetical protein